MRKFLLAIGLISGGLPLFCQVLDSIHPEPGYYNSPIVLAPPDLNEGEEIVFRYTASSEESVLPFLQPILLDVGIGQEQTFNLSLFQYRNGSLIDQKNVSYVVDKHPPSKPTFVIKGGEVFLKGDPSSDLFWIFIPQNSEDDKDAKWNIYSGPLRFPPKSGKIIAYSVDPSGNKSELSEFFTDGLSPEILLLSPKSGTFVNKQLLALYSTNDLPLYFTLDGRDPFVHGKLYEGPTKIDLTGDILVRASTVDINGVREEISVRFTVEQNDANLNNVPDSGAYNQSLSIPLPENISRYRLNDMNNESEGEWFAAERATEIRLSPPFMGERVVSVEMETKEKEYANFIYLLLSPDLPVPPLIETQSTLLPAPVTLHADANSRIYYTIDGTSPDETALLYSGPFMLSRPDNTNAGSLLLKAVAYDSLGRKSSTGTRLFTYDNNPPETPSLSLEDGKIVFTTEANTRVVYTLTLDGTAPKEPAFGDPYLKNRSTIHIPFGLHAKVVLKAKALDDAGNLSNNSATLSFSVDRQPPETPRVNVDNGLIHLSGEGQLYWSVSEDTFQPNTLTFSKYSEPISLESITNQSGSIFTYAQDLSGNKSQIKRVFDLQKTGNEQHSVSLYGIEDGSITNREEVTLFFSYHSQNSEVLYTVTTDGSIPPDPNLTSDTIKNSLTFRCPYNEERHVFIKYVGVTRGSKPGEIQEIRFTMDRIPPEPPVINGVTNGTYYNNEVQLSITTDQRYRSFISIARDDFPADPFSTSGQLLTNELRLSGVDGELITYRVLAGVEDPAGNRTVLDKMLEFYIDKSPPPKPVIQYSIISDTAKIRMESEDGEIYYSTGTDVNNLQLPGNFVMYEQEVEISLLEPTLVSAFSLDRAGNRSTQNSSVWLIPEKDSVLDPAPEISRIGDQFLIQFQETSDSISFSIGNTEAPNEDKLEPYQAPIVVNKDSYKFLHFKYGTNDINTIPLPEPKEVDYITETIDGQIFNRPITLHKAESFGKSTLVYAISSIVPSVQAKSRMKVFPESLHIDPPDIDEIDYYLSIGRIDETTKRITDIKTYSFTMDTRPPQPPSLSGTMTSGYYQQDISLSFTEEDVEYRIKSKNIGNTGDSDWSIYSGEPVLLSVEDGTFSQFMVEARRKDSAGNISNIRTWNFTLDKAIVYLDPKYKPDPGNFFQEGEGTRTSPFTNLQDALSFALSSGRNTIFIKSGTLIIDAPIIVPSSGHIEILGGINNYDNLDDRNLTEIVSSTPNTPSFTIEGVLEIERCRFTNSNVSNKDTLFYISDGELTLTNSELLPSDSYTGSLLASESGKLSIIDSKIITTSSNYPISLNSSSVVIKNSTLSGGNLQSSGSLISSEEETTISINRSTLTGISGAESVVLNLQDSELSLMETTIVGGLTSGLSENIHAENSRITVQNSYISGNDGARITRSIYLENSSLAGTDLQIQGHGITGAVGIEAWRSSAELTRSKLQIGKTDEFTYILRAIESQIQLFSCLLTSQMTGESVGISLDASELLLAHNTLFFTGGDVQNIGILGRRKSSISMQNTIMSGNSGNAFTLRGSTKEISLRLLTNIFTGWEVLLNTQDAKFYRLESLQRPGDVLGTRQGNRTEETKNLFVNPEQDNFRINANSIADNTASFQDDIQLETDLDGTPRPGKTTGKGSDIGAYETE